MLELINLEVRHGAVRAVQGASLKVKEGEVVALIGANGAGKSSLMQAICGAINPSAGSIRFEDEDITGMPPHKTVKRGIVLVPEGRLIFGGLSVEDNLRVGALSVKQGNDLRNKERERILELFPMLKERWSEPAAVLSGGQQQMLALARGLMAQPKLLLLDEPSLGLAPVAAKEVFTLIKQLRQLGTTILLVEQNVHQSLAIADRGFVLQGGEIVLEGEAQSLAHHELLIGSYLGPTTKEPT